MPVVAAVPTAPAGADPTRVAADPIRAAEEVGPIRPVRAEAADPTGPRSPHPRQYLLRQ